MPAPSEQYPPDPELSADERKQYVFLIENNRWGEAFAVQQSFSSSPWDEELMRDGKVTVALSDQEANSESAKGLTR